MSEENNCNTKNIMQFHNYIFSHNPSEITVKNSNKIITHFCPGMGEFSDNLGMLVQNVECLGNFLGDNYNMALLQLNKFIAVAQNTQAGLLYIPGLAPFMAYVSEFVYKAQGSGRIISYNIKFTSKDKGGV